MILYPAIDIKDGEVVRLLHGDLEHATVFGHDPAAQAVRFVAQGFQWLHLVDLNGAVEGKSVNADAIEAIVRAVQIPVQLGGGIRDLAMVENWLGRGVSRVVLGTIALRQPELVKEACKKFPGKIAVGVDARDGYVAVSGWVESTNVRALDLALQYEDAGAAAIIYTDINRDGALGGVNLETTVDLAYALTTPVIASGGVASLQDLLDLKAQERAGIAGVIVGRALYDGRIDVAKALMELAKPMAEEHRAS